MRSRKIISLLLLLLIGLVSAGPLNRDLRESDVQSGQIKCAKSCIESQYLQYQIGHSYVYQFNTSIAVSDTVEPRQTPLASIRGNARITVQEKCEHVLKLENVLIDGVSGDKQKSLLADLEANQLAFAFVDGEVANVCPFEQEKSWTLNIKKAILSSLQINRRVDLSVSYYRTQDVVERDILGDCDTHYTTIPSADGSVQVLKTKDIGSCENRVHVHSPTLSDPNLADELLRYVLYYQAERRHRCDIKVVNKRIQSVECSDRTNSLNAFKSGMSRHSEINIKLLNEDPVHFPPLTGAHYVGNLLGERNEQPKRLVESDDQGITVAKQLKQVCVDIKDHTFSKNSAPTFRKLIQANRQASFDDLKNQLATLEANRAKNDGCDGEMLFKLYLDSLIATRTSASLKLLVDEVITKSNYYLPEDSPRRKLGLALFFNSLLFYTHPTEEQVESVSKLIQYNGDAKQQALFGVSGMIHNLCRNHTECNYPVVTNVANELANSLPANCQAGNQESDEEAVAVIEKLLALTNIGHLPANVIDKVISCAANKNALRSIRLAAIKAISKESFCNEKVKKLVREIIQDANEHDEIRIAVNKAFAKCASESDLKIIEKLLAEDSEISSLIHSQISLLRSTVHVGCSYLEDYKQLTSSVNIDRKVTGQSQVLRWDSPFTKKFSTKTVVVFDGKHKQPVSLRFGLRVNGAKRHFPIVGLKIRNYNADKNHLLRGFSVQALQKNVHDAIYTIIGSGAESADSKELVESALGNLVTAVADILDSFEISVCVGGKVIYYHIANEKIKKSSGSVASAASTLASIIALNADSSYEIQTSSGIPVIIDHQRNVLLNYDIGQNSKSSANEYNFTPNAVLAAKLTYSFGLGDEENRVDYKLSREGFLVSNFGLLVTRSVKDNTYQYRLKLNKQKVDLLTHSVEYQVQSLEGKKETVAIKSKHFNNMQKEHCSKPNPLLTLFGVRACFRFDAQEHGIYLERLDPKSDGVLITYQINDGNGDRKRTLTLESNQGKRQLNIHTTANREKRSHEAQFDMKLDNDYKLVGNFSVKPTRIALNALVNNRDQHLIELRRDVKNVQDANENRLKLRVKCPHMKQPFELESVVALKRRSDNDLAVRGELIVNTNGKKSKIASYDYNRDGLSALEIAGKVYDKLNNRHRRDTAAGNKHKPYHNKLNLQLNDLNEKELLSIRNELGCDGQLSTVDFNVNYTCLHDKTKGKQSFTIQSKVENKSGDKLINLHVKFAVQSTEFSSLNADYEQRLMYKKLEHLENDVKIRVKRLQQAYGDEAGTIKLLQVSRFENVNNDQPNKAQNHLMRLYVGPLGFNREYNYNSKYVMDKKDLILWNDTLTAMDLSTSKQVFQANFALNLDRFHTENKLSLNFNLKCQKHGQIDWKENLEYNPTTKAVSSKIKLVITGGNPDAKPQAYSGRYQADQLSWLPNKYELTIIRDNDNTEVLHLKGEYDKQPNEVKIARLGRYYGEVIYDVKGNYVKDKKVGDLSLALGKYVKVSLGKSKTADGLKYHAVFDYLPIELKHSNELVKNEKMVSFNHVLSQSGKQVITLDVFAASNPNEVLKSYKDVRSASLSLKTPLYIIAYKREQKEDTATMNLDIENPSKQRKLAITGLNDPQKLQVTAKVSKKNEEVFAFDSTIGKQSPSVFNLKSTQVSSHLKVDPFGKDQPEWKLFELEVKGRQQEFLHNSNVIIRKNENSSVPKDYVVALRAKTRGKSMTNEIYERNYEIDSNRDLSDVKLRYKRNANGVDKAKLEHSHKLDKEPNKRRIQHSFTFEREGTTYLKHNLDFDVESPKLRVKRYASYDNQKVSLAYKGEYPSIKYSIPKLNYFAKLGPGSNNRVQFEIQVRNDHLGHNDNVRLNAINEGKYIDYLAAYDKKSNEGHNLENYEISFKKSSEADLEYIRFNLLAPRGWHTYTNITADNANKKVTFNTKATKRSFLLYSSDVEINGVNKATSYDDIQKMSFVAKLGFNGNAKYAYEVLNISGDEVNYRLNIADSFRLQYNGKTHDTKKTGDIIVCGQKDLEQQLEIEKVDYDVNDCNKLTFKYEKQQAGKVNVNLGGQVGAFGDKKQPFNGLYEREDDGKQLKAKLAGEVAGKRYNTEIKFDHQTRNGEAKIEIAGDRVILFKRTYTKTDKEVKKLYEIWADFKREPSHKSEIEFAYKNEGETKFKSITWKSPALKHPVILSSKCSESNGVDKGTVEFEFGTEASRKFALDLQFESSPDRSEHKRSFRFHRGDSKIDFGCAAQMVKKNTKEGDNDFIIESLNRECFWVDRNGHKRTSHTRARVDKDSEKIRNLLQNKGNSLDQLTTLWKISVDVERFYRHAAYDIIVQGNPAQRFANIISNWQSRNGIKYHTDIRIDPHSFESLTYQLPKDDLKFEHELKAKLLPENSDTTILDLRSVARSKTAAGKLDTTERVTIIVTRNESDKNELHVRVRFNPDIIGEAMLALSEEMEAEKILQENLSKEIKEELADKCQLLTSEFKNEVLIPARTHVRKHIADILGEVNPEWANKYKAHVRLTRAVSNEIDNESQPVVKVVSDIFSLRVVKFNMDDGEIEFYVRTRPNYQKVQEAITQSVKKLFH